MRVNRDAAVALSYNQTLASGKPTGTTLDDTDVNSWLTNIERELPNGDGIINCSAPPTVCVVTVQWDDSRGAVAAQQFVTSTEI